MSLEVHYKEVRRVVTEWNSNFDIKVIYPLPQSGSHRTYFRVKSEKDSVIVAYNADVEENNAFFAFTFTFLDENIPVPEIYYIDKSRQYYVLQDLGDITLFRYLVENDFDVALPYYKKAIDNLIKVQLAGKDKIDFSLAYPIHSFNKQAILWDLNYFKYYFLKFIYVPFNEEKLEDAFRSFADYLVSAPHKYFMYRDFQSRNIMLYKGETYLIDYQGGRMGAVQYDLASLLYDSKANLSQEERKVLYDYYVSKFSEYENIDEKKFEEYFYAYVLVRVLQAFGAYGYRGIYEQKIHFLRSIPYAIRNLQQLLTIGRFKFGAPYLFEVLHKMISEGNWKKYAVSDEEPEKLTITISSFSYKAKIPVDTSGNGGGFVFDCRSLPNPGRIDEYKDLTGQNTRVIDYFKTKPEVDDYLSHVFALLEYSTKNYLSRDFKNLSVYFGCTGGQHRSVYCAEKTADFLTKKFGDKIIVKLTHTRL
jgi:aminoglycoside/choline kinase family phosphotransferase